MTDTTNVLKAERFDTLVAAMYGHTVDGGPATPRPVATDPEELTKRAADRAEWTKASEAIGARIKRLKRQLKLDLIVDRTARTVAKALQALEESKRAERIEKSLQKAAEIRAKTERINEEIAVKQAAIAEVEWQVKQAQAQHVAISDQSGAFARDARIRIDGMMARLESGTNAVRQAQLSDDPRKAARLERERAEWAFKAANTQDPILKQVYLAKANGWEVTDDD